MKSSLATIAEAKITIAIAGILTLTSLVLMLVCASPEFSWDEADYVLSASNSWHFLWASSDYNRHGHGPMDIYLAKASESLVPKGWPIALRFRLLNALAGSLAIGILYWVVRHAFAASRAAALASSCLLLFSVIRLEETSVVGPHHLMLVCTLALMGLGYRWLDTPSLQAGIGLGVVLGLGALSMTYVIPASLCWGLSVALCGREWIQWKHRPFRVAWAILAVAGVASLVVLLLWPPGVVRHVIVSNFRWYLHYAHATTLVGGLIYEDAPRWAFLYWLVRLESPLLFFSIFVIGSAYWSAFRRGALSRRHAYIAVWLGFFLFTALAAHIAGARNLLQFTGVLCVASGVLWDEAFGQNSVRIRLAMLAVVAAAIFNLAWLRESPGYTPYLETNGFRAFFEENANRLQDHANALVYNTPAFRIYEQASGTSVQWDVAEIAWTPRASAPLPSDTKYVLIPELVYAHMPPEQPMHRIVANHWKVIWSHKERRGWELRLYENPEMPAR
ncbi:MAG TPA: glycosyltransferase family 39 protein [Candidatus Sulfotelmatobacter sp.]|nr:glycosyltransferase family 39 protein [Candidatus Sulfotelmatobacter sp.]